MRTMVPPCETPASPNDDLTRICVHDQTSQVFVDDKKNRYNSSSYPWATRDGPGNPGPQEQHPKDTQCVPLISTDVASVIEKLQPLSCAEKECSRSRDSGSGIGNDYLDSSKKAPLINTSNSTPNPMLENNNNNNNKSEVIDTKSAPSQNSETKAPAKRVRATHRRNLSLDFRAMGIVLPPLSEVAPSVSPPRILHNIPESPLPPNNEAPPPSAPAITPKIKHVVRRILSRRISRYE